MLLDCHYVIMSFFNVGIYCVLDFLSTALESDSGPTKDNYYYFSKLKHLYLCKMGIKHSTNLLKGASALLV